MFQILKIMIQNIEKITKEKKTRICLHYVRNVLTGFKLKRKYVTAINTLCSMFTIS